MITVKINTVDKSSLIDWENLVIENNLFSEVDTCSFIYKKYGNKTLEPNGGDTIQVWDGAVLIFGGVISEIKRRHRGVGIEIYDILAKDWSEEMDRMMVSELYENKTVNYIINDIRTNYTTGFTQVNVNCTIEIKKALFKGKPVSKCIDELAKLVNYEWYIDPEKDIHFFAKGNETAPFNLTDTTGKYIFRSLELNYNWNDIVNSILIEGGEYKSSGTTTHIIKVIQADVDAGKKEFATIVKFAEKPTITINAISKTVGIDYLNRPEDYDILWNFQEKLIRFRTDNKPALNDLIAMTGYELIPVIMRVKDQTSINTYGERQFYKIDKSINNYSQGVQYANAFIAAYKDKIHEATFRTYSAGLKAGQKINVQSDIRNLNLDLYIKRVVFKTKTPTEFEYEVSAMTQKTAGIIDFLQQQILDKAKELGLGEEGILTKYKDVPEEITAVETIFKDIGAEPGVLPDYVFAPYTPSANWPTDKKRQGIFDSSGKYL